MAVAETEARHFKETQRPPRAGRPVPERTLADVLAVVLRRAPMRITEAAEAVRRAGYRSSSVHFRQVVANALRDESRFQRLGHGLYVTRRV